MPISRQVKQPPKTRPLRTLWTRCYRTVAAVFGVKTRNKTINKTAAKKKEEETEKAKAFVRSICLVHWSKLSRNQQKKLNFAGYSSQIEWFRQTLEGERSEYRRFARVDHVPTYAILFLFLAEPAV